MRSCLSLVTLVSLLFLTASGAAVLANQNCARYQCAPICTRPDCPGLYSHYVIGQCNGGVALVRCYWTCQHFSNWIPCLCPDCECTLGGGCFLAGTPIRLADGSTKPIELVRAGDRVASFGAALDRRSWDTVEAVHRPREVDQYLVVNGAIRMTESQPVLRQGEWVEASRLRVGDALTGSDGREVPVTSVELVGERAVVYNLRVGTRGAYIAHGVVVHNKPDPYEIYPCPGCGP